MNFLQWTSVFSFLTVQDIAQVQLAIKCIPFSKSSEHTALQVYCMNTRHLSTGNANLDHLKRVSCTHFCGTYLNLDLFSDRLQSLTIESTQNRDRKKLNLTHFCNLKSVTIRTLEYEFDCDSAPPNLVYLDTVHSKISGSLNLLTRVEDLLISLVTRNMHNHWPTSLKKLYIAGPRVHTNEECLEGLEKCLRLDTFIAKNYSTSYRFTNKNLEHLEVCLIPNSVTPIVYYSLPKLRVLKCHSPNRVYHLLGHRRFYESVLNMTAIDQFVCLERFATDCTVSNCISLSNSKIQHASLRGRVLENYVLPPVQIPRLSLLKRFNHHSVFYKSKRATYKDQKKKKSFAKLITALTILIIVLW